MACRRPFAARRGPCVTRTFRRSRSAHGGWREGQGAVAGDPSFFSPCARRIAPAALMPSPAARTPCDWATSLMRRVSDHQRCRPNAGQSWREEPVCVPGDLLGPTSHQKCCPIEGVSRTGGLLGSADGADYPIAGFSAWEAPSSALAATARRRGPRTSRGVVRGPGRGAVSEAVSARPRRWRPGAGGRPGARRWREGPRPREARRVRPRSWSRS